MIGKKVLNYLDKNKIKYDVLDHRTIYTAYDLANTLKSDLKKIAKTLLIKADKDYIIVVIPAYYKIDLKKLKAVLKVKKVTIPTEKMLVKALKVKIGGITPFGALHKLETVVDKSLLKANEVIINAGSFTQSLRLKAKDFVKLGEVRLASFVQSAGYKPVKVQKLKVRKLKVKSKKPVKRKVTKKLVKKKVAKKKPVKKKIVKKKKK